jgi:LysM repeat protein
MQMKRNMKNNSYRLLLCFAVLFFALEAHAQRRNTRYVEYIKKYEALAVEQMRLHKIPASITLAQGLLESGAGYSQLARLSNNHFGIKCGSGWSGRSVRHDDDARDECFRAYKHVSDSYEDHSRFLLRSRYAALFKLNITDYKGWARGLKRAGYATDPSYANRLITIIEDYELYKYDYKGSYSERKLEKNPWLLHPHQVYLANDIAYVIAQNGDSFKSLGKEFDISWKKLVKYNDLQRDYTLMSGDIIYLKRKRKRASKPYTVYVVRDGDSMHSISQKYGIRLKNLYKMNRKEGDYVPEIGDRLRLR